MDSSVQLWLHSREGYFDIYFPNCEDEGEGKHQQDNAGVSTDTLPYNCTYIFYISYTHNGPINGE